MACQEGAGRLAIGRGIRHVERLEHRTRLVFIGRRATVRRQEIGGECYEAFERHAAGDIADMGIEATVLVNDDHGRKFAGCVLRDREIALHFTCSAGIGHI